MLESARYATAHWLRFSQITLPEQLLLSESPQGALSWKIGSCGPVGPNGNRLPSEIWCAVALFRELPDARNAFKEKEAFMPFIANAIESWHQLLLPIRHHGECNHIDRESPGELFEVAATDPGGLSMVITSAGYRRGPDFRIERVIDFRRNVDLVLDWLRQCDGCLASQAFTPLTIGDDGLTLSLWQDDASMLNASYRPGLHRTHIDRHKSTAVFDRSSFTRCRILESSGQWNSIDPLSNSPK